MSFIQAGLRITLPERVVLGVLMDWVVEVSFVVFLVLVDQAMEVFVVFSVLVS